MKPMYRARMKKMVTESKEDGGASGAVLAIFIAIVLVVGFVILAVRFGYSMNSIITAFQRFFGMAITQIGA